MNKQTLKHFAVSSALLGLLLGAPLGMAQGRGKLPGRKGFLPTASRRLQSVTRSQGASGSTQTPADGSPSYTFSFVDYPQSGSTNLIGINSGAASSKLVVVGGNDNTPSGFTLQVEGKSGLTYAFKPVTHPSNSDALGINDFGQIVGEYTNSSDSYELSGTKITTIAVPFAGTTWTQADDINNSGEVVGIYWDSIAGVGYGFSLSGGVYTQLAYPGAAYTETFAINNLGEFAGFYVDSSGTYHGLLISGGTYTSFDVPGAMGTLGSANNDSGDIVGFYCTTSECITDDNSPGSQGFLLSGGVYTTINVPGATSTELSDINNNGVINGIYFDSMGVSRGFIAFPQ